MFELDDASKRFGDTQALHPTTLTLPASQTHVLIGPSGCGKSTTLRLLNGLVAPDTGVVRFDGAPLEEASLRQVRLKTGYVIQSGGLFPHLSAEANVALMARRTGWEEDRVEARLDALCALVRLDRDTLSRHPSALSGGQRQRVSLMRALMLDPGALLLDEPLGALDPLVRDALQAELSELFEELKKTVVLVTHDMAEAARLGATITLMRAGRVVQHGPLEALRERPADPFVTRFLDAQRGWSR